MSTQTTIIRLTPAQRNITAKAQRSITATIAGELIKLRAASRASARTLDADDAEAFVRDLAAAWAQRGADDMALSARLHGGIVPNSYRYSADSDEVAVELSAEGGYAKVSVTVERGHAPKRAGGHGHTTVIRLIRPGQSQGRVAFAA